MEYTPQRPMSIDQFKARTAYKHDACVIMAWVAVIAVLFAVLESIRALFVPIADLGQLWITVGVLVIVVTVVSRLLYQAIWQIDHKWHLYRGEVEMVGTLIVAQDADGATLSYYPVFFVGDEGATHFSPEDYARQADALQPGKRNVLVVRRSVTLGSPIYEAAARVSVRVS